MIYYIKFRILIDAQILLNQFIFHIAFGFIHDQCRSVYNGGRMDGPGHSGRTSAFSGLYIMPSVRVRLSGWQSHFLGVQNNLASYSNFSDETFV